MATAFKPEEFVPDEPSTLPVQRASIEQIDGNRRRALELFEEAFDLLQEAGEVADSAALSGTLPNATYFRDNLERLLIPTGRGATPARREKFLTGVRHTLDRAIWNHLLEATELEKLMDKQAREEFREQLEKEPPEATAQNCYSTLSTLIADADDIFMRGIANSFSKLDRRFRSHDGFKLGSRIALSGAFNSYGMWNHYARHEDTLRDVERTFVILDGKQLPERYAGIVGLIDDERRGSGMEPRSYEVEDDYFKAKAFKNGNLHIWFKRKDLVEQVNKLLAQYYGATLGEGADSAQPDAQKSFALRPAEGHAKNFGFFPTSPEVAARVLEIGEMTAIGKDLTILEPSAGTGALIEAMTEAGADSRNITAVEYQADLCFGLRALGLGRVIQDDFLAQKPEIIGQFDRVVMNPPFDKGRDVDHVLHAMKFVKPGGKLIAIMAAGVDYREDAKSKELRRLAQNVWKAIWFDAFRDLPPKSFAHAGTNVNTLVLAIRKPIENGGGK